MTRRLPVPRSAIPAGSATSAHAEPGLWGGSRDCGCRHWSRRTGSYGMLAGVVESRRQAGQQVPASLEVMRRANRTQHAQVSRVVDLEQHGDVAGGELTDDLAERPGPCRVEQREVA